MVTEHTLSKKPRKNTKKESTWLAQWESFLTSEVYASEIESDEYKNQGICQKVTYPRIKTVITGKRGNGTMYSEGISANLKFFTCSWTPRKPEDYLLSNALCLHIKEMIELQNSIEIDQKKNILILNMDDYKKTVGNPDVFEQAENIWVNQNMVLGAEELELLTAKGYKYIPKEFFGQELKEAAE